MKPDPPLSVRRLGVVDYTAGLELQRELVEERRAGRIGDTLLLLEHPPVITLGVTVDPETDVTSIENVAAVTYHAFGDPADVGHDDDVAGVVLLYAILGDPPATGAAGDELALTGPGDSGGMLGVALTAVLSGIVLLYLARRRRGEDGALG